MAEALLAFGVAANVVAFIDFTAKIISAGSDKYGGLSDLNIVETVNEDLRATLEELETSVKRERGREGEVRLTENQIGLLNLARECDVIAKEVCDFCCALFQGFYLLLRGTWWLLQANFSALLLSLQRKYLPASSALLKIEVRLQQELTS